MNPGRASVHQPATDTLRNPARHGTERMRILLARHGETPWNAEGRYQGQEDIPLSPTGEAQARSLGERLRGVRIDRAVASPLARARRTAELALGEARASMLAFDDGLLEIAHGTWEGLLASEIAELVPGRDSDLVPQLPAGSMRPKVEAAFRFVEHTGGEALITSAEGIRDGLPGTRIVSEPGS